MRDDLKAGICAREGDTSFYAGGALMDPNRIALANDSVTASFRLLYLDRSHHAQGLMPRDGAEGFNCTRSVRCEGECFGLPGL